MKFRLVVDRSRLPETPKAITASPKHPARTGMPLGASAEPGTNTGLGTLDPDALPDPSLSELHPT
jgi:hypothetical protein